MDVLCILHDSDEYGIVRWPLADLASASGAPAKLVRELVDKRVLKGSDGTYSEAFIYVPRHGRKDGEPVTLVAAQTGPLWYSTRMVRDEYVRTIRGDGTRFGDAPKDAPNPTFGDGSTSSSSSSPSGKETSKLSLAPARPSAEAVPDCPHQEVLALWAEVLPAMPQHLPHEWRGARADHLRVRWRETAALKGWTSKDDGLTYFRRLFAHVGRSQFLTGKARPKGDGRPFVIELEWLVNPTNWAKVHEGKYHQDAA